MVEQHTLDTDIVVLHITLLILESWHTILNNMWGRHYAGFV